MIVGPDGHRGFVTEEMFAKQKNDHEIDLERPFSSAQEVDKFLEENRWPQPGRLSCSIRSQ